MKFSITITLIYTGIHLSNWKWQIQDGRWFQFLIYVINDVIMTSQLGLKILNDLANFSILSDTSMYFRFIATLREIWILPINSTIWRFNDIKLRHGVNQVMPRCEFDVRIMSGFEVIRRASDAPPPVPPSSRLHKAKKKKKTVPVWIGLRCDDHRLRRRIKMLLHIISTTWLFVTKGCPKDGEQY